MVEWTARALCAVYANSTKKPLQTMIGYVITILGLPHSETGAARCIESGHRHGIEIEVFPAVNRYNAEKVMQELGLFPNSATYSQISDDPVGDRSTKDKGQWHLTKPELGCALSHYLIWCKAARASEPTLVLEHDAMLVAAIPEMPANVLAVNHVNYDVSLEPGTVGYTITPTAANLAIANTKRMGVEPSDELLWRSALKGLPVHQQQPPSVTIEDNGVSTIQWTRSDKLHERIVKQDPWAGFREPSRS